MISVENISNKEQRANSINLFFGKASELLKVSKEGDLILELIYQK
ncbi:hypothetical protein [Methanobrevibacter sp. TMH8]|nr:hypothetical protein [Methanobrevibacter sp. TMH8]